MQTLATARFLRQRVDSTAQGHLAFTARSPYTPAMRPSQALELHRSQIREIAMRHRVAGVSVFGSAINGGDDEGSDLDLLVEPTQATTLFDIGAIRHELKALLGIDVDVLTPNGLPDSFREQVLREAVRL
jgi:predicted nucleotidyltransferase